MGGIGSNYVFNYCSPLSLQCQSGQPGTDGDNRVSGGLVQTGSSITSIDRSPDFTMVNAEILNP